MGFMKNPFGSEGPFQAGTPPCGDEVLIKDGEISKQTNKQTNKPKQTKTNQNKPKQTKTNKNKHKKQQKVPTFAKENPRNHQEKSVFSDRHLTRKPSHQWRLSKLPLPTLDEPYEITV